MSKEKKKPTVEKKRLHERNKHRQRYNFEELILSHSELKDHVQPNKYGDDSVDFFNPESVKQLNTALLKHYYNIKYWEIPKNYLCPPIPGRADYIHNVADLLFGFKTPDKKETEVRCLDIGTGANCVFPIIGVNEYNWTFVGSETDKVALDVAQKIINNNKTLKTKVELRHQEKSTQIFKTIIRGDEKYELSICNPPFHSSAQEAMKGSARKVSNLKGKKVKVPVLNFGGQSNELWCEGGEVAFIKNMILESKKYRDSCLWFTTLVAKQKHLKSIQDALGSAGVAETKTIPMGQGNKSSRIVAWTFFPFEQRKNWKKKEESTKFDEEEIDVVVEESTPEVKVKPVVKKKVVSKSKPKVDPIEEEETKPKVKAATKKKTISKPKAAPVNESVEDTKTVAKAKVKKRDKEEAEVETKTGEVNPDVKPAETEEAQPEGLRKRAKGKIISRTRKTD